ncbi:MAG: Hint domain-containing protein [Rhodobacteraceae bacterium]|nr:Hint domain-containing protein [Paracoccaceae bacterium]
MNWVGLADAEGAQFDLTGLANRTRRRAAKVTEAPGALANRGTLLMEADVAQFTVPRELITHALGASYGLSIAFGEADGLDFDLSLGRSTWSETLPLRITDELQVVRISYAWDVASRAAVLSVYQPRSQHLAQVLITDPRPMPLAALRSLVHDAPDMCRANEISFLALSREFEPAGAMPGLDRRTLIDTSRGPRRISEIAAGDLVYTADGDRREVISTVSRVLPARGSFAPYNLHAPYLGLERDLLVSGETLIELQGSDVEYLLGVEQVLAQASQVGDRAYLGEDQSTATYHQLILEEPELLDASIGVLSLNLCAAQPNGLAAATTLWADVGGRVARHIGDPLPLARLYEVITLNAARAA